jgi:hypothetical protein
VQKVRFGLSLDGQRGWHLRDALGEPVVGPLGMLTLLETQLGLLRVGPAQPERVVQMRECLAAARDGSRFYEASFAVDELGTAATLLGWRELWHLHGWNGTVAAEASPRLRDMAAVELLAATKVAPGVGQRLRDVESMLGVRRPQIASVTLLDPLADFPLLWRRVLARLPVADCVAVQPSGHAGTLLRELQERLLAANGGGKPAKLAWRDDGSVRIVRGESPLAAAQWLAQRIRGCERSHAVIAERAGALLDAALAAQDLPRRGLGQPSAFRPTLQLLPLAMRLLWHPLDFGALLQFLTHPVHPLPPFARGRLAEKMAEAPGIGGSGWAEALRDIEVRAGEDASRVLEDVRFWVEHERHRPEEKAPLTVVYQRVDRLAEFFHRRLNDEDEARRAAWHAGHAQAAQVRRSIKALIEQGVERIGPEALDKLVAQATARGTDNPLLQAQAGAQACVTDAAALIEPFDEVFWWHLAAAPLPAPYVWSPTELRQLREAGVELPDMDALLARQARGWLQPVLHARERLTLVLPRAGEEVHPLWLFVSAILDKPPIAAVEAVLADAPVAGESSPVPHRPLPARRRWWQLPAGATIRWPDAASFSSLEQLFFNPYQWVLRYAARLYPSSLLALGDDFRLLGNLAHRMVERLYRQEGAQHFTREQVLAWFDAQLDEVVAEEGAVLLMPGRRADLESFRLRFRESLARLHGYLNAAKAVRVEPEKALEGSTTIGLIRGSSDLLLGLAGGGQAIVDLKWKGEKKYREKLATQTHIQLAIYGKLRQQATGDWPAVAYYILHGGEMLTTAPGLFPGVSQIAAPEGATAQLWQRIVATYAWRKAQIDAGAIEVVFGDIEATDESQWPEDALPIEPLDPRYNPYVNLAGWEI